MAVLGRERDSGIPVFGDSGPESRSSGIPETRPGEARRAAEPSRDGNACARRGDGVGLECHEHTQHVAASELVSRIHDLSGAKPGLSLFCSDISDIIKSRK